MSKAVGAVDAGIVSLVGPLWGGIIAILATPLFFLTLSRALFHAETIPAWDSLLITAGLVWLALLPFAPIIHGNGHEPTPDEWRLVIGMGVLPLVIGVLLAARGRRAAILASRDIRER